MGRSLLTLTRAFGLSLAVTAGADAPTLAPPAIDRPTGETLERLRAGEIVVLDLELEASGGGALAYAVVHADVETLWRTIGDCDANRRFVRGLRECEVVQESATRALSRQRLKPYAFLPALEYRFETVRSPFEWIRIQLVDGDLRALRGSWRIWPLEETDVWLVAHRIHVQTRFPAPRWLIRKTLQQDVGDLMACLRWELRGWRDPRQRGRDRARCPD